jgi:hypothetical protein
MLGLQLSTTTPDFLEQFLIKIETKTSITTFITYNLELRNISHLVVLFWFGFGDTRD